MSLDPTSGPTSDRSAFFEQLTSLLLVRNEQRRHQLIGKTGRNGPWLETDYGFIIGASPTQGAGAPKCRCTTDAAPLAGTVTT